MKFPKYFTHPRTAGGQKAFFRFWSSPLASSLSITAILFSVQLFFIRPYFLVNDDILKILMTKGIGTNSVPTEFFGYSNVILGFLFKQWFSWFPSFPWYGWFLCAVQFFSIWAFLWILRRTPSHGFHTLLFIPSCLAVNFIFFTFLQFTMTAAMAAQAGILLLYFSSEPDSRRDRRALLSVAGLLILLSSLIRLDSLLLMLLVSAPLFIFRIKSGNLLGFLRGQWKFTSFLAFAVAIFALFNLAWFQRNSEWKNYSRFDGERLEMQDYRIAEYSPRTKPFFDSVGWSENDFWLFKNWLYVDEEKYSVPKIEKLKVNFSKVGSEGKIASHHSLRELFGSFWDLRILMAFFVAGIFCRGKVLRVLLVQFSWIVVIFLFLIYFLRAPDRVTLPILLFLMNLAILFSENHPFQTRKGTSFRWAAWTVLLAAFVFSLPEVRNEYLQNGERRKIESRMGDCLKQMDPSKNQLYVMWAFPFEFFSAFDDFERFRPIRMFVANFSQRCPPAMGTLKDFGIEDLMTDLVDNPKVFLNCSQEQGVRYGNYLKENHHRTIRANLAFGCGPLKVYSIHSAKKP